LNCAFAILMIFHLLTKKKKFEERSHNPHLIAFT